jgi:hypothetical protein
MRNLSIIHYMKINKETEEDLEEEIEGEQDLEEVEEI